MAASVPLTCANALEQGSRRRDRLVVVLGAGGSSPLAHPIESCTHQRFCRLVNYMLVMRNEREDLVAIGPVSIEYQAAMIRDELEESAGWTTVGIARVLTEKQARTIAAATGG